jgi:HEAT repeat protein
MQRSNGYGVRLVAFLLSGLLGGTQGSAQGAPSKPSAAAPGLISLPRGTLAKLRSSDASEIRTALDEARLSAKAALPAVPVIVDLLEKGLPFSLTESAVDTLGDIESEQVSMTISSYARHRDVSIRRSAVKALVRTKGAPAVKALRAALSDDDATVRGVAATGLGSLKAKEAIGDLFVALDHRVNEAAVSIGELCGPAECESLEGRLGRVPFDVVTSGFDPILFRPPAEVSDDAKVKLIGRLRELGTAEANKFLRDAQARWPQAGSERVKRALELGVQVTVIGSRSGGP